MWVSNKECDGGRDPPSMAVQRVVLSERWGVRRRCEGNEEFLLLLSRACVDPLDFRDGTWSVSGTRGGVSE